MLIEQETLYLYSAPLFLFVILTEMIYSHFNNLRRYNIRDLSENIYLALINISLDIFMKGLAFFIMNGVAENVALIRFENSWIFWPVLFIGQDFMYYWEHRVEHRVRIFWAVHLPHHSSEHFNITTGFRSPVLQPLYRYLFFLPLAFIGFNGLEIMFAYAMNQNYGTLIHTQSFNNFSWLGKVFVSPVSHRIHHAKNIPYLDKNYGMVLIIWDKIFGTYQSELKSEKLEFGIRKKIKNDPVNLFLSEWFEIVQDLKKSKSLTEFFSFLFKEPGWSADGKHKSTAELQRAFQLEK